MLTHNPLVKNSFANTKHVTKKLGNANTNSKSLTAKITVTGGTDPNLLMIVYFYWFNVKVSGVTCDISTNLNQIAMPKSGGNTMMK